MLLHNHATSEQVAEQLRKLTDASHAQQHHRDFGMRQLAERTYNHIYEWLEEHQVKFEYDRDQGCYVVVEEVEGDND